MGFLETSRICSRLFSSECISWSTWLASHPIDEMSRIGEGLAAPQSRKWTPVIGKAIRNLYSLLLISNLHLHGMLCHSMGWIPGLLPNQKGRPGEWMSLASTWWSLPAAASSTEHSLKGDLLFLACTTRLELNYQGPWGSQCPHLCLSYCALQTSLRLRHHKGIHRSHTKWLVAGKISSDAPL